MFNKKEMKLVSFEKAKKELMNGVPVFMVKMDGNLEELTEATHWRSLLFHNLKGGGYAIYRKKFIGIKNFHKEIHIGKKTIEIVHAKEGGDASWMFASYKDNQ